jgi:hypothetical protein
MTAHTLNGLISLIENISSYRSDKPTDEQKTEACTYAAALAGQAPKVPEGFALVPLELTPEMVSAGADAARAYMQHTGGNSPEVMYRAMLAAASKTLSAEALQDPQP